MEDFITIPQLAQGFNVSEKVIRHTFKKLLKQNKLIEGEDYIREGYRDELHFVYKIHPGRFAVHSKLIPASSPVNDLAIKFATTGSQSDSRGATQPSEVDSKHDELGIKSATQFDTHGSETAKEPLTSTRVEGNKSEGFLEKLIESKDEQVVNLKEHVADLREQLAKKDEIIAQAQSMVASMQEGQNSARDLIQMLGERVIDFSRRELPSGSNDSNLGSNSSTHPKTFATQFGTHDEQSGSKSATTPADQ